MKHTKGIWTVEQKRGNNQYEYLLKTNNGQNVVAEIRFLRKADANVYTRLIAAAPDLLAVCKQIEWVAMDKLVRFRCPICMNSKLRGHRHDCKLKQAIAKVKGY